MQKNRRILEGVVVSANMVKTVSVEVTRTQMHTVFGKYLRRRKSFLVHDEKSECKVGDRVEIRESRPISKRKRWAVLRVIQKGGEIVADTAGSAAGEVPAPEGGAAA
ncbi:MAG: 30S ribosomal protein S17 [Nitrospirae bacterium]|nr:30S ribosomal protein S17 [Nitrospirota bacterium]